MTGRTKQPASQQRIPRVLATLCRPGALFRIGSTRLQHGSSIYAVAAAPDGKLLASVSWDGDLSIWEMPTGRERYRKSVGASSHGNFLAFTPDAKSLLLNKDNKLCLLDVETGQISKQLGANAIGWRVLDRRQGPDRRGRHRSGVWILQPARRCLSGSFGRNRRKGSGAGWAAACLHSKAGCPQTACCVAMIETYHFNNNAKQTLRVHEVASGKELYRLKLSAPYVRDVTFVGDNKFVVTGSSNSTLRVWELATGKAVREWKPDPRENVEYSRGSMSRPCRMANPFWRRGRTA